MVDDLWKSLNIHVKYWIVIVAMFGIVIGGGTERIVQRVNYLDIKNELFDTVNTMNQTNNIKLLKLQEDYTVRIETNTKNDTAHNKTGGHELASFRLNINEKHDLEQDKRLEKIGENIEKIEHGITEIKVLISSKGLIK